MYFEIWFTDSTHCDRHLISGACESSIPEDKKLIEDRFLGTLSCEYAPLFCPAPYNPLYAAHPDPVWPLFISLCGCVLYFFCECQVLAPLKCKLWVVQWEKLSVERLYCFFFCFSEQSKVQRTSVVTSSLPGNLWYPAPLCPRTQLWPNNLALFCYCPILEDVLINNIHPEYLKNSYNEKVHSHRKSEPAVGDSRTKI